MINLAKKVQMCTIGLVLSLTFFTVPCSAQALMLEKNNFTESEFEQSYRNACLI